jgi:iron(III) transport system substrate-binding protein
MRIILIYFLFGGFMRILVSIILTALLSTQVWAESVNVYSARKEQLIKPLFDQFTKKTGITVNLVTGKADALLTRLQSEGKLSPADMLITTDAGRLHRAKESGLLQSIESKVLNETIASNYRDSDKQWFALSLRARPIMFNKDKAKASELSTYEALADSQYKGRICIRSSSNIYNQSLVASMIAADGEEKTLAWAKGLVQNFAKPPKGGDRDQIKASASGICDFAIANTYYLGGMLAGNDEKQKMAAEQMQVFWPNQDGRGAHVNVSGAGVLKTSKNREAAIKLLEFLVSKEAQRFYADVNFEYPVRSDVAPSKLLAGFGEFKADDLNLDQLGELNSAAVKLMDKAGWR